MDNLKTIKNRIKTIGSIIKTTDSMKMVATVKLARVNNINKHSKECASILLDMFTRAVKECIFYEDFTDGYWFNRKGGRTLILVLSTNQGFCGAFNQSILETTNELINKHKAPYVEVFGKRGNVLQQNREESILLEKPNLLHHIPEFSQYLTALTLEYVFNHNVSQIFIVSGEFKNVLVQKARSLQIFPIEEHDINEKEYIRIEGNRLKFLEEVFEMYISKLFRGLVTEHLISEFSARVMAMDNSVRNANDVFEKLQSMSNQIRQSKITQELTEIVSSIECVR